MLVSTLALASLACGVGPRTVTRDDSLVDSNGVSLNGVSLNGVSLNGSNLTGIRVSDGKILSGTALAGTRFVGNLSNGSTLTLRIDEVFQLTGDDADVWYYDVEYQTATGWEDLCSTDRAVALAGRWDPSSGTATGGDWIDDPSSITFACKGTTLAKCVLYGYKPWKSHNGTPLRDHHQACTRMLRGDFCGDGTPHTVNGTTINLYDALGIETDAASWLVEAEWTPNGARCVSATALTRPYRLGLAVPSCMSALVSSSCGSFSSSSSTKLITEYVH